MIQNDAGVLEIVIEGRVLVTFIKMDVKYFGNN